MLADADKSPVLISTRPAFNYGSGPGAVFLYKYNSATKQWAQYGPRLNPTLTSTNTGSAFGVSIALDASGKTLVVGVSAARAG